MKRLHTVLRSIYLVTPLLAQWERRESAVMVQLRSYVDDIVARLGDIAGADGLVLYVDVDKLKTACDLDNFLKPLFWRGLLPAQFVYVGAKKCRGQGSRLDVGMTIDVDVDEDWMCITASPGAGYTRPEWKARLHSEVASKMFAVPEGPLEVALTYRMSTARRNWTNLWKPSIDSLGPILGEGTRPFHPHDERIEHLHLEVLDLDRRGWEVDLDIRARPSQGSGYSSS